MPRIFADEFQELMAGTVTVQSLIGRTDDGMPIYSAAASYKALIDNSTRNVISASGHQISAKGTAYVDTIEPITANDLVTFNDVHVPIVLLNVNVLSDENGPTVTILNFQ